MRQPLGEREIWQQKSWGFMKTSPLLPAIGHPTVAVRTLLWEPTRLQEDRAVLGVVKGLKHSRSAQSVCLACNNQLTECNCANPYVAVITREINGFLPF